MKKYLAPELTLLSFAAAEMIAANEQVPEDASNIFNDGEFGKY